MNKQIFAILLVALSCVPAIAQLTTGTVQGRVQDSSGAVIAGAELELRNLSTNLASSQRTNAEGLYLFSAVPPGQYALRASYSGFKVTTVQNIQVEVNRVTSLDVALETGDLAQSVEVSAAADNIDTQTSYVRTNVAGTVIQDLPSSSRNPLAFAEMAPGVNVNTGSLQGGSQQLGLGGLTANVSGGRQQQNTFYLDGADNSTIRRNEGLQVPNVEAIAEVQVVTNTNSAEYGKQPGGYFNVITKSGTNQIHGTGFGFFRDPSLNANEWGRNRSGLPTPNTELRQWGGVVGGSIVKEKTFYFGSFQRYTDQSVLTSNNTRYPTTALLAGDFSAYMGQLYDPDTKLPIAGNKIPNSLIDPVASSLGNDLFPTVANLGDRYVYEFQAPPKSSEFLGKVDHNFTDAHRINGSYFGTRGSTNVLPGGARAIPTFNYGSNDVQQDTLSTRYTWIASAKTILEGQFSFARFLFNSAPADEVLGRDIATYGGNWPTPVNDAPRRLPNIEILDSFNSGQLGGGEIDQKNYRGTLTLSRFTSAHTFKFGFEMQRSRISRFDSTDGAQFRFQGRFSNRGNAPSGSIPNTLFAYSFADYMMGRAQDFSTSGIVDYELPVSGYFGFAQDQWRISRQLTLNLGLRYEIWTSFREVNGRSSSFVEGHQSDQFPNLPLNVAVQGDRGIQDGFIPQDKNNFAPRIGVAYDVFGTGKTVIRGGYGLYYAFPGAQIRLFSTEEWPLRPGAQGFEARFNNPWLTSKQPVYSSIPTPFPDDPLDFVRTSQYAAPYPRIIGFSPDFTTPTSHQFNVSVEQELRRGITINIGYVSALGRNLLQGVPFNYARYKNLPDGTPPNASTSNIVQRLAFPNFSQFSIMNETSSVTDYHSLQASSNVRLRDLNVRVTYVYARDFGDGGGAPGFTDSDEDPTGFTTQTNNPANPRGEYGRRSRLHTYRTFATYDLPFFRGQNTLLSKTLGGWQLSGSLSVFSGNPTDVVLGVDANFDAITSRPQDRPDLIAPIRYTGGSANNQMARYFDPGSFGIPVIGANNLFGNLMRNALYAPGRWNTDLAVLKIFGITERVKAQFRAEAYNWTNHPNLDSPNTTMNAGDFTKILTKSGNRVMQLGFRVTF